MENLIADNNPTRDAITQAMSGRLWTREEAAAYLNLKVKTIDAWRVSGKNSIPFVKMGSAVRYRKSDLDAWIAANVKTASGT